MTTPSRYTPNPARRAALTRASDAGLIAAAQVVTNDVRRRFREREGGYTSGDFVHDYGGVAKSITQSPPHDHNGVRRVTIGTNKRSPDGFSYPLAWEMGHVNLFTRQHERVETFRPALDENRDRVRAAYHRAMKRALAMGIGP